MKTAIVADTNCGIPAAQAAEMGIHLVAMPFVVDGKVYHEGIDLTFEDFFRYLNDGADVSTSQPEVTALTETWEKLLQTHDAVLYFPMTAGLSGSCATAKALAQDYPGKVFVVDNLRISATQEQAICNAIALLGQGMGPEEVRDLLEEEKLTASIYIMVNTLKYLKKSGRITAAGAAMGSVLDIKPVLQLYGEKLDAFKKVRGLKNARKALLEAMKNDLEVRYAGERMALYSGYSGDKAAGDAWLEMVKEAFPDRTVKQIVLPMSICCHIGDGCLGIACARSRE